jgi:hypothetical protein
VGYAAWIHVMETEHHRIRAGVMQPAGVRNVSFRHPPAAVMIVLRGDADEPHHADLGVFALVAGVHEAGLDVVAGLGVQHLLLARAR